MSPKTLNLLLSLVLASCATTTHVDLADTRAPTHFANGPRRGRPLVVFLAPPRAEVLPVLEGLRSELKDDFDVIAHPVEPARLSASELGALIDSDPPSAVILVNNPTVSLYRQWATTVSHPLPAAIILMAAFAEELQKTVPNSTGISFEVPGITAAVGLRAVIDSSVETLGIVHRKAFRPFIERQRALAVVEHLDIAAIEVSDDPSGDEVRRALRQLVDAGANAVWLLNDNKLLTSDTLSTAWVPFAERARVPLIVGLPGLVRADVSFGTFGIVPDLAALGTQAANLMYELSERGFDAGQGGIRPPISVKTYLDAKQATQFGFTDKRADAVDVLVK